MHPPNSRFAVAYAAAYAGLLVCVVAPLWWVTLPPLLDYPNHLARMHILLNAESEVLSRFYEVRWSAIPNLAMDLVVPALAHVMPLEWAGKLFLTLTLVLLSSGTLALHYAVHRRLSAWPFAVFLLLYNGIFLYGILNFLFGLGLVLWALALWVHYRVPLHWRTALGFHAVSVLLFFAHLSALGVFVLSVLSYEAVHRAGQRPPIPRLRLAAWLAALAAGPALLVLLAVLAPGESVSAVPMFRYGEPAFVASQKLGASLLLFGNYVRLLDLATLAVVLWCITYGALVGRLALDRRIRVSLAALLVVFLVMPFQVFGANFADARILLAAAFLFVAAADLAFQPRFARFFAIGLAMVFAARMGVLIERWQDAEAVHAHYMQAIEKLPVGARLVTTWSGDPTESFEAPGAHLAAVAVMSRSVFLPSMYAMPRGQPITFRPGYLRLAQEAPRVEQLFGSSPVWARFIDDYDYVLLVREQRLTVAPPARLTPVFVGERFRLYRTPRASQ